MWKWKGEFKDAGELDMCFWAKDKRQFGDVQDHTPHTSYSGWTHAMYTNHSSMCKPVGLSDSFTIKDTTNNIQKEGRILVIYIQACSWSQFFVFFFLVQKIIMNNKN